MPTLLIIDDHQIYLDGLEMIILQSLPDASILKAYNEATAKAVVNQRNDIDLILLDLDLQSQNGLDIWHSLKQAVGPLPVAILSASTHLADIQRCQQSGALGFINKSIDNNSLVTAIKSMLNGELYFPYNLNSLPNIQLTPRQKQVLNLLSEGLPNKTICRKLDMSEATVKTHLRTIFSILDVSTRTQCVNVANKLQLI
jgi:DNA-binding NarL/FixJ family response regulator